MNIKILISYHVSLIVFLQCTPACSSEKADIVGENHHLQNHALLLNHFEDYSASDEYEIVTPYAVDHHGNHIPHTVNHSHLRKRSLENAGLEAVHFKLHGFGQDFFLDLKNSDDFLAPGFTVQTLGKNGTKSVEAYDPFSSCFYQGSVRSRRLSAVALSTCSGLSGLIRTQEADYILKPLPQHVALNQNYTAPDGQRPHILYKRAAEPKPQDINNEVIMIERPRAFKPDDIKHQNHQRQNHKDLKNGSNQKQHYCGRRRKYMPKPPKEDIFILPDEYKYLSRNKRSLFKSQRNAQLNVETLVVVDKKMMQKHGKENITTYVLTILNMVSALFKDGTIGGNINVIIVGLILLDEDQPGLVLSHHADHTLNSFCQWQSELEGKDGSRHDHAILLTGLDICSWKNEPCDTLGFAPISGMCSKYRSCTVNEDTGLGLAFTIAHESGHNFGMVHDGEGNICKKSEGNIMSPTLSGQDGVFSWSSCSRQYLNTFLSSTQAMCLADEPRPVKEYKYPEKLPGQLYDADIQCKWQFGEKAQVCMLDFKKDVCKALWCHRVGRKCETKFMPAAEGTACGPDMWCRRGQCVKYGDDGPKPVHGQWSGWSSWSSCSRTCGGGVTYQERHCTNPRPVYGGKFCEGSSRMYKLCNIQNCPEPSIDFRAQQCAEYNNKPFRGWYYNWKPYTRVDENDACKLYCIAEGFDFFFSLSSKVKDGTSCLNSNVCIDGVCETVGCDRVLGSSARLDVCGVCKGNNSTCRLYKGVYNRQHYTNHYYTVVTIPAGARSIRVYEQNTSNSYLSVRNSFRKYYLNGHWTVDWPGHYKFSGTEFNYERSYNRQESLSAAGPTNETLVFEILLQGINPGIIWEYAVAKSESEKKIPPKHNYTWAVIRTECSVSCGGGQMTTRSACYRDLRQQVNTTFCNPRTRPVTGLTSCKMDPCPPSWQVDDWGTCSQTCGGGEQVRRVQCVQKVYNNKVITVEDSRCPWPSPARKHMCNSQSCPPAWSVGTWSECSRTCGRGWRKRSVTCKSTNPTSRSQILDDSECRGESKPKTQENCALKRCQKHKKLQWFVSTWSECSTTCGKGLQTRFFKCAEKHSSGKYTEVATKRCSHLQKPKLELEKYCIHTECPRPHIFTNSRSRASWYASPWSPCTVTCGGGVQTRFVQCLAQGRPATGCLLHQKPITSQACHTNFCPSPEKKDMFCKDFFNWCYLAPQHGVCNHKFYGKQCCKSCSRSNL
ncbi:A disintegrin and metalloproteinase with thrombospondin motifs 16 [Protopterus annectens]|uniref:A disintegrin and metalloproteinase with thrombospondin motifs 16 n=1 Tax=Protopterus annectens TaxID=7888 RepID=UPI001CFBEFD6|nr:A disintegrin and metalloproteinase with thrombospondin motifs 16 [Protopterus annectens]